MGNVKNKPSCGIYITLQLCYTDFERCYGNHRKQTINGANDYCIYRKKKAKYIVVVGH